MSSIEPTRTPGQSMDLPLVSPGTRAEIGAANARFMEAFRRGDADGVAACYTAAAQLLPAQSDVIEGTEAIAGFWRGAMAMGIHSAKLETVEVESYGGAAVEIGRYSLAGADGATIDRGKYVVVWHREEGAWKLHRDIWTTSVPAQAG